MTRRAKVLEMPAADMMPLQEEEATALPAVRQDNAQAIAQGDALLAVIERAARDPAVDMDKMERLFRMKIEMETRDAKAAYLSALAEMQPKLPVITKRGVISKNEKDAGGNRTGRQEAMTKYAKWEDVVEGITPVLAEHGFSLSFRVAQPTPDRVGITGVLGHRGGHTEETTLSLPLDSSGAKNNVQGWGSSVSYGKRYTAFALLNISARGEDDDGSAAGISEKAKEWTDGAIQELNATPAMDKVALEKWRADRERDLRWLKKNAPAELERFHTAYSNAAEAAGIKKEEPKRPAAAKEQPAAKADKKGVTDVVDENDAAKAEERKPIEFEDFPTTRPFIDFSSKWLAEDGRTPKEAEAWEAFYREKMAKAKAAAENAPKPVMWIIDGISDLLVQYNLILAKEQEQQA